MKHRIVVKVGSNVLTRKDGKLDVTRVSSLVDQIAWLHANDYEVILVSSGAVPPEMMVWNIFLPSPFSSILRLEMCVCQCATTTKCGRQKPALCDIVYLYN